MVDSLDKIFIINLEHRTDRWQSCLRQLQRFNITNYERFSAIKPNLSDFSEQWYVKNVNARKDDNYLIGSLGCKLSHLAILLKAQRLGYRSILILEDDFVLSDAFNSVYTRTMESIHTKQLPWQMLYLGFSAFQKDAFIDTVIPNVTLVKNVKTTHAYIVKQELYSTLIKAIETCGCEIDVCYTQIQTQYNTIFGIYPGIVSQLSSYSDILHKKINYSKYIKTM